MKKNERENIRESLAVSQMQDVKGPLSLPAKYVRSEERTAFTSWYYIIAAFLFGVFAVALLNLQASPASFCLV